MPEMEVEQCVKPGQKSLDIWKFRRTMADGRHQIESLSKKHLREVLLMSATTYVFVEK